MKIQGLEANTTAVKVRVKEMKEEGLAVLRKGEGRNTKVKVLFPSGAFKWYPIRKIQIVDKDGKPERVVINPVEYLTIRQRLKKFFTFGLKS